MTFMIEKLDLSKGEDVKKLHDSVEELRSNELFNSLLDLFGVDSDIFDAIDEFADSAHDHLKEENNKENESVVPERPSKKLSTAQGLQIHKIVQEYVDTMIKPYNNGVLTDEQINDAYAGLYEFAAWILTK